MPTCLELNAFSDIPAIKIFLLMKLNARVKAKAKIGRRRAEDWEKGAERVCEHRCAGKRVQPMSAVKRGVTYVE